MALDPAPIAQAAAEFIDDLEELYGHDVTLARFAIVAQIDHDDETSVVRVHIDRADGEPLERVTAVGLMALAFDVIANPDD